MVADRPVAPAWIRKPFPAVTTALGAAWSSTVSVAEADCERFVALGSLAVKVMSLLPRFVEVTGTDEDWLALERGCRSRRQPACRCRFEKQRSSCS